MPDLLKLATTITPLSYGLVVHPGSVSAAPHLHLTLSLVEDVDPVQNTDVLGGATQEELSFPFVKTEEDEKRVQQGGIADRQ